MGRPTTKTELLTASALNYERLHALILSLTEKELSTPFDFSKDEKKKEAHWKHECGVLEKASEHILGRSKGTASKIPWRGYEVSGKLFQ